MICIIYIIEISKDAIEYRTEYAKNCYHLNRFRYVISNIEPYKNKH